MAQMQVNIPYMEHLGYSNWLVVWNMFYLSTPTDELNQAITTNPGEYARMMLRFKLGLEPWRKASIGY